MRFLVFLYCLFQISLSNAADINLDISQSSQDDQIHIIVENRSRQAVLIKQLELVLNKRTYLIDWTGSISSGHTKHFEFKVELPVIAGSYAQQVNLYYVNDSKIFTLTDVGVFYFKEPFNLPTTGKLYSKNTRAGLLILKTRRPDKWRLVLPREVTAEQLGSADMSASRYRVRGIYSGFNNNYPVFAVSEGVKDNHHFAQILKTTLRVNHASDSGQRGRTQNSVLLLLILCSLSAFVFALVNNLLKSRQAAYVLAYSSRLFWLSSGYYLLKNSSVFFADSALYLEQFSWFSSSTPYAVDQLYGLSEHLNGKNYTYFFRYFIDAYLWAFVLLYPVYLYVFSPGQPEKDKYTNCLYWTIKPLMLILRRLDVSIKTLTSTAADELQSPVKKGFLILAVKLFFLPLLASWVINNFIHQWHLVQSFEWNFHQVNAFILALLILTDTSIFLLGYMFESYRAKNQIRSVEPTLLGWVVCLWCYPPFNEYSFTVFDYQLFPIHVSVASWAEPVVLTTITLLWGVFVWASLTLGLKASNLTNRGTVSNGPYRFCRHPAYTAKIMIWTIEAIFLGKYFIGLLMGYSLIYFLRAWTEERHLALDADYRNYQQRVPYRFIPGLY